MAPAGEPPSSTVSVPAVSLSATSPQCRGYGLVQGTATGGTSVTVRAQPPGNGWRLCDDARLRVFWAVYRLDPVGVQHLYRSQVHYLDEAHNPLRLIYPAPGCPWSVYVVAGDQSIRGSIPAMADFPRQAPAAYDATASTVLYVHQQACMATAEPVPSSTPMVRRS
jgi:hypothetical protein